MMMNNTKGIIVANLAVMGLASLLALSLLNIQALYPFRDMVTDDRTPVFRWSGAYGSYELLIDDDPGFSTPLTYEVTGGSFAVGKSMDFGTYWWKVRSGDMESEPKKFTIVSAVELSRPEKSVIINTGNTDLMIYRSGLAGAATLSVNETLDVEEEENVMAEQK